MGIYILGLCSYFILGGSPVVWDLESRARFFKFLHLNRAHGQGNPSRNRVVGLINSESQRSFLWITSAFINMPNPMIELERDETWSEMSCSVEIRLSLLLNDPFVSGWIVNWLNWRVTQPRFEIWWSFLTSWFLTPMSSNLMISEDTSLSHK